MARPADGTGILEDPPLAYRTIVFSNGQLITHTGHEIWRASLSDGKLHKVAGTETMGQALVTGPCAGALFANIFGIALATDGSLYVSDQNANAILKISDPLGAGCSVSHVAGTPNDVPPGTITPDRPPNVGNVDGPGNTAKFGLPERMAIDSTGNVYVWDRGNNSIRKIANDAAHTVSTLVPKIGGAGGGALLHQVFLDGKLYVWGKSGNDVFLTKVDPTTGANSDLLRGRSDLFGGDSSDSMSIGGIVARGSSLMVFFSGQLFGISTDGKVSDPLAGIYRPGIEFPSDYDPADSHPASELVIPAGPAFIATSGAETYLAIDSANNVYISALRLNNYVEQVACP